MTILRKIFPFIIILILLLLIKNNVSSVINSLGNTNTTDRLKTTLAEEKKKNVYLSERLYYVKTKQFVEGEAREKLGLLKDGEYIVIAPTEAPSTPRVILENKPNWEKWLDIFF